jgi:hypothetical protein
VDDEMNSAGESAICLVKSLPGELMVGGSAIVGAVGGYTGTG